MSRQNTLGIESSNDVINSVSIASEDNHHEKSLLDKHNDNDNDNGNDSANANADNEQEFLHDAPSCLKETRSSVQPIPLGANYRTPTFESSTMMPHISSLQNEHSSYLAVSKACMFFTHLASYGSSSVLPPSSIVSESHLFDANYVHHFSTIIASLSSAAASHTDRRCRILSLHSLSIISKAIVAKLIFMPVYIDQDHVELITRLQDEIYNDVVMNIVSCALEDDDGVASVAFEALARLVIQDSTSSPSPHPYTHGDLLQREIYSITGDTAPWNICHEFIHPMQDVDAIRYNAEIRCKILEQLAPRVRKIMNRIQLLKARENQLRSLGFLNELVIFVSQKDLLEKQKAENKMDKEMFALRWYEFDSRTMIQEYIQSILIPLLRSSETVEGVYSDGVDGIGVHVGVCTATHALALTSLAIRGDSWVDQVIPLIIRNLELGLQHIAEFGPMESQMEIVATLLVALRGVSLDSRASTLKRIAIFVSNIPSTRTIPQGVIASALVHQDGSQRKPVRVGYWTEIAISFLMPDRNGQDSHLFHGDLVPQQIQHSVQYRLLSSFLESESVLSILKLGLDCESSAEKMVLNPAHEIVYSFCSVAYNIGKNMVGAGDTRGTVGVSYTARIRQEQWIGTALVLLQSFIPCLGWTGKDQSQGKDMSTMLFAAQRAYVELLESVMTQSGAITPSASIYYHFMISVEHSFIGKEADSPPVMNENIENRISLILVKVMQEMTNCIDFRKIRLSILSLLTDAWIQQSQNVMATGERERHEFGGPVDVDNDIVNINERHAQNILSMLGSEISSLIRGEKIRTNKANLHFVNPVVVAGEELRSLLTCISCVESIAYTAQLCANYLFSTESNVDDEESARYLVSVSMLVLKGQGKVETDGDDGDIDENISTEASESQGSTPSSPPCSPRSRARITAFTSECTEAAKRLQNFVGLSDDGSGPISVDFDCLCPLLKRPNFGVPLEEGNSDHDIQPSRINDKWMSTDRITLVDCNVEAASPTLDSHKMPVSFLLNSDLCFDQDTYEQDFIFQLCRQQVSALVGPALNSNIFYIGKETDNESRYFNAENVLRIQQGSSAEIRELPLAVNNYVPKVQEITGCADPISATMSYSIRRCVRYDSHAAFKAVITIRVYNVTPVSITNGLKLSLILTPNMNISKKENCPIDEAGSESSVIDETYMSPFKGGQYLTWELVLDPQQFMNHTIGTSISLMGISSAYDDGSLSTRDAKMSNKALLENQMLLLVPNPHVLFERERCDERFFLFIWQNMQHSLPVVDIPSDESFSAVFPFLSDWVSHDLTCGEQLAQLWALSTWSGQHLLVMCIHSKKNEHEHRKVLIKSSDKQLLEFIFR